MTQRKSKTEKDIEAKAALRQAIYYVYAGACGEPPDGEDFFLTLEPASRAITALKGLFGEDGNSYLWQSHCLGYFDTVDSATEHLFAHGVRVK